MTGLILFWLAAAEGLIAFVATSALVYMWRNSRWECPTADSKKSQSSDGVGYMAPVLASRPVLLASPLKTPSTYFQTEKDSYYFVWTGLLHAVRHPKRPIS